MAQIKLRVWNLLFRLPRSLSRRVFLSKSLFKLLFSEGYTALNELDRKMEGELPEKGFFLEIGGNDGISQSNTKHLELYKGWHGILVEPNPENFRRMGLTRDSKTHKVHAACVPAGWREPTVTLAYADLQTITLGVNLDLEDQDAHLISGSKHSKHAEASSTFSAPAKTLTQILVDCGAPPCIDFFSLDVEGAEIPVLEGLDFSSFSFSKILVESRSIEELQEFMQHRGYRLSAQRSVHDYLFIPKG